MKYMVMSDSEFREQVQYKRRTVYYSIIAYGTEKIKKEKSQIRRTISCIAYLKKPITTIDTHFVN